MSGSLSRKVGDSVALLFFRKAWGNVINLLVMTILARLLTKEDFGLLAISAVLLSIVNTVATGGLSDYLIYYDKPDSKKVFNAVFWLNLFLTFTVCLVVLVSAPFWAAFYGSAKIQNILWLLLLSFFFEMISMVPRTLLRKELQYRVLVRYSSIFMTLVSAGKLVSAYTGMGVYSLVLPQAIFSPLLALAFFLKTGYRPALDIGKSYYKSIIQYGKHLLGGKILTRLVNQGDNLIIGKLLGMEVLGAYSLAFQLANLVTANVVLVANDVIMPVLSKVKNDPERLRRVFLDILGFLSLLSFPLITTLVVFAKPFIFVFYGHKWADAIQLTQILCLFALGRSINSPTSLLYNAVGRPDVGFKFTLFFVPIFLLSILLSSYYGIVMVAIAVSIVRFGGQLVSTSIAFKLANIQSKRFYSIVMRSLLLSLGLVTIFLFMLKSLDGVMSNTAQLFFAPLFAYGYLLCMRILVLNELKKALDFMRSQKTLQILVPYLSRMLFIRL